MIRSARTSSYETIRLHVVGTRPPITTPECTASLFAYSPGVITNGVSPPPMALLSNLYNGPKRSFSKRHALFAALLLFIIVFSICHRKNSLCSVASGFHSPPCSAILSATRVHQNIAIASDFGFHYDVYLAVAWTLERVMKGRGSVQVYADTPYFFNFSNMSDELGLYHGSFKKPAELIPDIQNSPIDMVIFGTCEMECVQCPLKIFTFFC